MKLYICGNGLDIHHGLDTNYENYRNWLINNGHKKVAEEYEKLDCSTNLWKDIEASLGEKWKSLVFSELKQYIDKSGTLLCDDLSYDLENMYRFIYSFTGDLFFQWLSSISVSNAKPDMLFEKNSAFISFNYTDTLEKIYNIPPESVLHIHGDLRNVKSDWCFSYSVFPRGNLEFIETAEPIMENDKWNSDVIRDEIQFGGSAVSAENIEQELKKYTKDSSEVDESIHILLELSSKVIKQPEKNFSRLYSFLTNKDISEVVIVGLSIGDSDKSYFQKVFLPQYSNLKWSFYCHNSESKKYYEQYAQSNGISNCRFIPYP